MMWRTPRLLVGEVMHRRVAPVAHGFRYPVFACLLPMHALATVPRRFFSLNRFNLLAWHARDHGLRDGSDPLRWLAAQFAAQGVPQPDGEVWLQAFPRVLGFVFNPVSFWYCFDAAGSLRAVLAEVSNTFGERHNYLVAHADGRAIVDGDEFRCAKVFHVSPFFPVSGHYRFRFSLRADGVNAHIAYADSAGEPLARAGGAVQAGDRLHAAIRAEARAWTDGEHLRAFFAYPWMTIGVVLRIHWQAARLYFGRRLRFFRKPPPPLVETTR